MLVGFVSPTRPRQRGTDRQDARSARFGAPRRAFVAGPAATAGSWFIAIGMRAACCRWALALASRCRKPGLTWAPSRQWITACSWPPKNARAGIDVDDRIIDDAAPTVTDELISTFIKVAEAHAR